MKTDDPMHYARIQLRIAYCRDTDTLEILNGERVHSSYALAEGLTAHLDADGETAGFTLEKARTLLLPHLSEYDAASVKLRLRQQPVIVPQERVLERKRKTQRQNPQNILKIGYCQRYDILDLWNERGASFGWDVGAHLTAFSRDADGQELNGFTLECAAQMLLPCFQD
jgi:uncharacterized protein YuzE